MRDRLIIYSVYHGLNNDIETKAKCRHLQKFTCKGQVFIRVHRLKIQSIMLVFSTQFCELLPLSPSLWFTCNSPPPSLCQSTAYTDSMWLGGRGGCWVLMKIIFCRSLTQLPQSPFAGQFFSMTTFCFGVYIVNYSPCQRVTRRHRCQWHQWQITGVNDTSGKLPPVSTTLAANLPPVSTTPRQIFLPLPLVLLTPVANNGNNIRLLSPESELEGKNLYIYVSSSTQRWPNKIIKIFLI